MSRRSKRRKVKEGKSEVHDMMKLLQVEILEQSSISLICWLVFGHFDRSKHDEWKDLSDDKKIELVLNRCKGAKKNKSHPLVGCVKNIKFPTLKRLFKTYVNSKHKSQLTREVLEWELIYKFLGEPTPLESRENETKNLSEVENLDEFLRFTSLCGKTIPKELSDNILCYLERSYPIIVRVGSVCKHFYLSLLSSWTEVKVDKTNLRRISLLILRSVTTIKIPKADKLLSGDLEYLWSNVNSRSLRKLSFEHSDTNHSRKIFRSIKKVYEKCEDESKYVFQNVTHLELLKKPTFRSYYSYDHHWDSQNEALFPKIFSLKGVKIVSESTYTWNMKNQEEEIFTIADGTSLREIGFTSIPHKGCFPKEGLAGYDMITRLIITNVISGDPSSVLNTLPKFKNLEVVELRNGEGRYFSQSKDVSYFYDNPLPPTLTKVVIFTNLEVKNDFPSFGFASGKISPSLPPLDYDYDTKTSITHLEIMYVGSLDKHSKYFDYNLEDLLTSTKLLQSLKSYKCRIPLAPGRRNLKLAYCTELNWMNYNNVMRERYRLLCHYIPFVQKRFFEEFIFGTILENYESCDVTITMGKVDEEYFRIRYERDHKRMRIYHSFICGSETPYDVSDFKIDQDNLKNNLVTRAEYGFGRLMICMFLKEMQKRIAGDLNKVLRIIEFKYINLEVWNNSFSKALEEIATSGADKYEFDGISSFFRK